MPDDIRFSACPHDCPSTCALEIETLPDGKIGRVRGARDNTYTDGVICEKVSRYTERAYHPDRLLHPLKRIGAKGDGEYAPISWEDALDEVAEALLKAEQRLGSETVWPYFYAGTMGLVMRDGINRLRHAKNYSGQYNTICTTPAFTGFIAGTGKLMGVDPREMALSDLVVIWGTNAVNTQVNVMTHVAKARKNRDAKVVVIDTYKNGTAEKADLFLCVRPGTDGALACGIMHVLFRDGYADRAFLESHADAPGDLEDHLKTRTPEWASNISGVPAQDIEALARMIGETPRTFLRLGYGFTRSRNGAVNMHAAASVATVAGLWKNEGGGAFHNNGAIYHWDKTMIEGLDAVDPSIRVFDQSRIGAVLTGSPADLAGGPPVTALFIQNTNPMSIAPDLTQVHDGFNRDDLFVCVHEQFMTETANVADIVLPATMFTEHDDVYQSGGHQHITLGPKLVEAPGECRSNHDVICALADRLGADHPGFQMSPRDLIDWTLQHSGWGDLASLEEARWIDCQPSFEEAHYANGFAHDDGRFHFRADWRSKLPAGYADEALFDTIPALPDHWDVTDSTTAEKPFRLVTAPARTFLNSTFNETPSSLKREGRPNVQIHPDDAAALAIEDDQRIEMGNDRGAIVLHARIFDGVNRGVVISESIWPNAAFEGGKGINVLTGADGVAPVGGAAFHDTAVWIRAA